MFRDFIYLDTDRIQSILAQLLQGLETGSTRGVTKEVTDEVGVDTNLYEFLKSAGALEGGFVTDIKQNKVLHDYAFDLALRALRGSRLVIEGVDHLHRDSGTLRMPDNAFVLVSGQMRMVDYATLEQLMENFGALDRLFTQNKSSEQQPLQDPPLTRQQRRNLERQMQKSGQNVIGGVATASESGQQHEMNQTMAALKTLVEVFLKGVIQLRVANPSGTTFIGTLDRQHLREDLRSLIFKYGSRPQANWHMLCQVARVTTPADTALDAEHAFDTTDQEPQSVSEVMDGLSTMMNALQELVIAVEYPYVLVSPIAVYRELQPLT